MHVRHPQSPAPATVPAPATASSRALGLLLVAALVVLSACGGTEPDDGRVRIMASIYPLADLARQVAGDAAEVDVLVPPGVTPHGFELTSERVGRLARADVVLVVGMEFDSWAERAAARTGGGGGAEVLRMAEMVGGGEFRIENSEFRIGEGEGEGHEHEHEHGHGEGTANPHLWLDPVLAERYVMALGEALAERYPDDAAGLRERAAEVAASVREVHEAYEQALGQGAGGGGDGGGGRLVTFHNAFDRLAERYGLEVVAHLTPVELSPGGEVAPARLRAAIDAVREYELRVIYAEPQFPESVVRALERETGAEVRRLDPLGHPEREGYETYQAMMRSNLKVLIADF
ncbi:MAG: metal ABC transporter substrate-binding protein [Phycisphaeraceae bacterium]